MRPVLRLAVILACVLPGPLTAQQGDTVAVSLERALEIGRVNNPAYRRSVNDLELNGAETRATWGRSILPQVSVNLFTGYNGNLQKRATDPFGNPVANPNAAYTTFSRTQQGLGLFWQLQGPSLLTARSRQDAANDGRVLAESVAGEDLRLLVQRRFFDALEQEELLVAQQEVVEEARSEQETAEGLFELALKTRVDVLQAELEVRRLQLDLREQTGRRDQARLALRTVLGQQDAPAVKPVATPPPVFDPSALDAEALVGRASKGSASVRQQASALRQAEGLVSQSRGTYWPTLNANFQLGRLVQGNQSASLFSFGGLGDAMYSQFSVGLSIPFLSDVLGNRLAITRAEVARENQRDALRQARLESEQAARSALLVLQNRWESLQIADRSLAIAQEALDLARQEYRLGSRTFEQLHQSIRSEAEQRRLLIEARYGFVDALLDLESAVGGPVR